MRPSPLLRLLGLGRRSDAPNPTGNPEQPPERGARAMKLELSNVVAVARREYLARGRTRTFRMTTAVLVIAAVGVALAPILIRWADQGSGPTRVELAIGDTKPAVDVVASMRSLLNPQPAGGAAGAVGSGAGGTYDVEPTADIPAATARVESGQTDGLLIVSRDPATADLTFRLVTKATGIDRLILLTRQAVAAVAVQERLARAGINPTDQARLFAPPVFSTAAPSGRPGAPGTAESVVNDFAIGFVLSIVLFMAILLYGQWVAYSVAEEKSSRVMEVILGAASPFELLAGKVVGVGSLALTQYAIIFVPAAVAVLLQDRIASLVLGTRATATALPAGLSVELLVVFGILFVLGFALYAVLYAGAAALVSRTEDINAIVAPMTLVSTAGYMVAIWSSTGLIPPDAPILTVMSYIPFFSPYLVLSRMSAGTISSPEIIVSLVILAVSVPIALWIAARLYAAGVLMYGQRPGLRLMVRVLRGA